ncbi:murein hydrolase activator EnvC [Mesorhizobium sp. LHD-90]|uniref:murein hydrolase activator EnvC family protein n=1 Tax=Mesorhizobium sp. LHD-90 TaxID=3071414 RepID=UPI0027E0C4D7|nr:murein hydrolase activator EnvC [Mesorhizobium sp. LHD-90]MDQ6432493.1 murein hydrolase activator EnvC [Mesorhizobium sp. LHD-90]
MADRTRRIADRLCRSVAGAAMLLAAAMPASGEQAAVTPPAGPEAQGAAPQAEARRAEYESVSHDIQLSADRLETLAAEVAGVKQDYASITAALIQAAKTEKKLGQDIEVIALRLDRLKAEADTVRASLASRRGVLAEVLGALQRMGLNPPPAILVRPEDALSSVRSAVLLGAVVPELRHETETLMADMAELSRIAGSIEAERGRLAASAADQVAEQRRLNLLLEAKQKLQGETEAELAAERKRAEELAAKAGSLKELIASLDKQAEKDRAAAELARAAKEKLLARDAEIAALPENNRSMASLPFPALHNQLALPVNGRFSRRFGGKDDNGGVMQGDTVATQSGAIVTAPADGNVLYAGPFRSYGQLLILDAGDGYHVVLAGMDRITVALGRSVLAGEPVGAMGEARVASALASKVANGPELYVEFRKDGKPVDPSPWWAERLSGRTGNDT